MQDKPLHIVFKTINFVYGDDVKSYKLTFLDKHVLNVLSKHHGPKGIYPSINTIANSLEVTPRSIKRSLKNLSNKNLIQVIFNPGKSSHYALNLNALNLSKLNSRGDTGVTTSMNGVVASVSPQGCHQRHQGSDTSVTQSIQNISTELSKQRGASLSVSLMINQELTTDYMKLGLNRGLTEEEIKTEFQKFIDIKATSIKNEADFRSKLAIWFIRAAEHKRKLSEKNTAATRREKSAAEIAAEKETELEREKFYQKKAAAELAQHASSAISQKILARLAAKKIVKKLDLK